MDGVTPVNLLVTDVGRGEELGASFSDDSRLGDLRAAVVTFPNATSLALCRPEIPGQIAGSTVVDIDLPRREAADDSSGGEE